jgi:hypothetical protein
MVAASWKLSAVELRQRTTYGRSRSRAAVAALLSLWTLIGLLLASVHLADGDHAAGRDGGLVHVAAAVGDGHAACREHSRTATFDRASRSAAAADHCWLLDIVTADRSPGARVDVDVVRLPQPIVEIAQSISIVSISVLSIAPKTSPPV